MELFRVRTGLSTILPLLRRWSYKEVTRHIRGNHMVDIPDNNHIHIREERIKIHTTTGHEALRYLIDTFFNFLWTLRALH